MTDRINGDMTFFELMRTYPASVEVLRKYNLGCVGCMGAQNESLEQGAKAHGIDPDQLVNDLNAAIQGDTN